ncbi:MAG: lysophospholipid acyltransferase family protein [Rhodocyclaceae bacterium]|nr:lysophospholipid acyltransferase family protein [Rhodocyclaceae bacterium]
MITLFRLLSRLPLALLHKLGAMAGWVVYGLSPTYRRHLEENLAQAGLTQWRKAAIAEAGKLVCELPKIWLRPAAEVARQVVAVEGWCLVEHAWAQGKGILFLTPHLGCFEITAQYYAAHRPITVLYRPAHKEALNRLIEAGRGANLRLAPADLSGVRKLLSALKRAEAVGLLPDQAPKAGEGVWASFFGRPAYTMTLASRLSAMGVVVILAWAERLPKGRGYHLHLYAPSADLSTPEGLNRELERMIREKPAQYLWGYNRYKRPAGAPPPTELQP